MSSGKFIVAEQIHGQCTPLKEPIYNFAKFMKHEQVLRKLREEELLVDSCNDAPSGSSLTPSHAPSYRREGGKPVYGSVSTAGYVASRSDFEVEHDNTAETVFGGREEATEIADDESGGSGVTELLQLAVIDGYLTRLRERSWRKRVVRDHALIDSKKTYSVQQRLETSFGSKNLLGLSKFMRFLTGPQLDLLVESLLSQIALRSRLNASVNYRSHGIRFKSGVKIFENLNKKHSKNTNELTYHGIELPTEIVGGHRSGRKPSAPLVLHHLPGYSLLDEDEKQLCSTVRLVPETYYNFKQLLVTECQRHDGLKLATARQIVKIDVNKTRKMYDLLKQKTIIWPPKL